MSRLKVVNGSLRHLRGWKPDLPDTRDKVMQAPASLHVPVAAQLPQVLQVFDQGQIGSCTANMGANQMSWLEHVASHEHFQFSRLFIYAATRTLEGTPLAEDSGCQIRDVMKALAKYGSCVEDLWPYQDPEVNFSKQPPKDAFDNAMTHQALFYYRCGSLRSLKASIAQGFPVGFGFTVYSGMMSDEVASTGILHFPKPEETVEGGHAVLAVGYDDTKAIDGIPGAVLVQNSWGTGWGQGGFFWMPYSYFFNQLADDMWTLRRIEL